MSFNPEKNIIIKTDFGSPLYFILQNHVKRNRLCTNINSFSVKSMTAISLWLEVEEE